MHGTERERERETASIPAQIWVQAYLEELKSDPVLQERPGWSKGRTWGSTGIPHSKPLQGESGAQGHAWVKGSREHQAGRGRRGDEVKRHYTLLTYQGGKSAWHSLLITSLFHTVHTSHTVYKFADRDSCIFLHAAPRLCEKAKRGFRSQTRRCRNPNPELW